MTDDGRYFGFIEGIVTEIDDDDELGRIKARMGAMGNNVSSGWLVPAWPGSIEALPDKGDAVLVGFIHGDPNFGFWLWSVKSTSRNRPTEAMVLGTTAWGMLNYFVTQFNQLRADFNSHIDFFNAHVHAAGSFTSPSGAVTGTSQVTSSDAATTAVDAQKGKAADGSVVPSKSSSEKVLSAKSKLR